MTKFRPTKRAGDYLRTFASEDGKHYRHERQDLAPAMERSKLIQEAQARNGTGQNDRRYIGSIPTTVLIDWLNRRGLTMADWAINAGGTRCPMGVDPLEHCQTDGGVKSEFLRYFLSREFSKLHTQHTTTRRESSSIVVPNYIGGKNVDKKLRGIEGSGS